MLTYMEKLRGLREDNDLTQTQVAEVLGNWGKKEITYAGGIHSYEDLQKLKVLGRDRIDFTIGSALDLFGGNLEFERIARG